MGVVKKVHQGPGKAHNIHFHRFHQGRTVSFQGNRLSPRKGADLGEDIFHEIPQKHRSPEILVEDFRDHFFHCPCRFADDGSVLRRVPSAPPGDDDVPEAKDGGEGPFQVVDKLLHFHKAPAGDALLPETGHFVLPVPEKRHVGQPGAVGHHELCGENAREKEAGKDGTSGPVEKALSPENSRRGLHRRGKLPPARAVIGKGGNNVKPLEGKNEKGQGNGLVHPVRNVPGEMPEHENAGHAEYGRDAEMELNSLTEYGRKEIGQGDCHDRGKPGQEREG